MSKHVRISSSKKEKEKEKKKNDPLFDNPMFQQMKQSLSKEDQKKYDQIGKELYESINFETGEVEESIDVLAQLKIMIQSGLHPSFLSYEEKQFLENYLGKTWYLEFGYLENDLHRVNL
jgi:hypothetical protein